MLLLRTDDCRTTDALRGKCRHHGNVSRLADSLQAALAGAGEARLREVAQPWSETEEFWGQGDPAVLGDRLIGLAALARRGRDTGQRLYCWICL